MIVTVDLNCIFKNGDQTGQVLNYARPILKALSQCNYEIAIFGRCESDEALRGALNYQMIPFTSINTLPRSKGDGLSFNGIVRIEDNEQFHWLEIRDNLSDVLLMDYQSFYKRYCANVMNEAVFYVEESNRIINQMIEG